MLPTDYVRAFARSWWLIVLGVVLGVLAMSLLQSRAPANYTATTSVLISPNRAAMATSSEAYTANLLAQGRALSYASLATEPQLLDQVLSATGSDLSAQQLQSNLEVSVPTTSSVLAIRFTHHNPTVAREVVTQTAEAVMQLFRKTETRGDGPGLRVSVPSEAVQPTEADAAPPWRNPALGALAGLALGLALAVIRARLDRKARTPEEIGRTLEITSVDVIPGHGRGSRSRTKSSADEAVARLRTRLFFHHPGSAGCLRVAFTSAHRMPPHDLVAAVASSLADTQARVLLILAGSSTAGSSPQSDNDPGLLGYLDGTASLTELIRRGSGAVDVITTGHTSHQPEDLLHVARMEELMQAVSSDYAFVLIEAPSLAEGTGALALAARCDGVLLTLPRRGMSVAALKDATEQLASVEAPLWGAIVVT